MAIPDVGVFLSTTRLPDVGQALAAVRRLGFRVVQLGKLDDRYYAVTGTREVERLLRQEGLEAAGLCIVYEGESYADVAAVRRTVGFLPPETVAERISFSERCIGASAALGIPLVTFHVGLLPADPHEPGYRRVYDAVNRIAAYAAGKGVTIGLETGQETAEELLAFLARLDAPVGVNFDGANFIAYGMGDPLDALRALCPRVVGVHLKDYARPAAPGLLSRPAPLGRGAARVDETIDFLLDAGFAGPLILETYDNENALRTLRESRAYTLERLERRSSSGRPVDPARKADFG